MAEDARTHTKDTRSGYAPRHSAEAVRLMQSQPAAQEAVSREMLKLDAQTKRRVLVAAALVVALLVSVLYMGASTGVVGFGTVHPSGTSQALTTRGFLEMMVRAEDWEPETSTPVILRLRNEKGFERYHALNAEERSALELEAGTYQLSFISPINADGSMYQTPEEHSVSVGAGHTVNDGGDLVLLEPSELSREDYLAVIDATQVAVDMGDETLRGEAGQALMAKLRANAEASPSYAEPNTAYTWDYPYWGYEW